MRTKSACPCGNHVKSNVYYIRRPGPKSEQPQSGAEWDVLIDRCARAKRDELLSQLRALVMGEASTAEEGGTQESALRDFADRARSRFNRLLSEKLAKESPSRYQHGVWTIAYRLAKPTRPLELDELFEALEKAKLTVTGWPEWVVMHNEFRPYVYDDLLECFIADPQQARSGAHSDFWRTSPVGDAYLLRGYNEDFGQSQGIEPGKFLSLTTPIWRTGEAVLHATRLAKEMGAEAPFLIKCEWEGLAGRELASFDWERRMDRGWVCRQPTVTTQETVDPATAPQDLPGIVSRLTKKLYRAFDMFAPPEAMFAEELEKMTKGRR